MNNEKKMQIGDRQVGYDQPTYIVAELSANHKQQYDNAIRLIEAAKRAGADAVKLQTYTPDTITFDSRKEYFQIEGGTIWDGKNLHDLYSEAYTPWEWHPRLKRVANELGIDLFSTPFDDSAVDFLEQMEVPAFKISSFEIVDIGLIKRVARTHKPVILSTGMATLAEIDEAVREIRSAGNDDIALLKCTSAYPALPDEMNLRTIPHLQTSFDCVVGLSDHTLGISVPVGAVTLGARIIEKHLVLSEDFETPDSDFSLTPDEFREMVESVRTIEKSLGRVEYGPSSRESKSIRHRRSLFAVEDIKYNERFTRENVRSIRPADGLHPRYLDNVLGRHAQRDISKGTPLSWDLIV